MALKSLNARKNLQSISPSRFLIGVYGDILTPTKLLPSRLHIDKTIKRLRVIKMEQRRASEKITPYRKP